VTGAERSDTALTGLTRSAIRGTSRHTGLALAGETALTAWRTGGYWSPHVVNLGSANQHPTLQQVKAILASFGLL